MLTDLEQFHRQITATLADLAKWNPENLPDATTITNIVYCGLGGSAIGGDIARGLVEEHLRVPMHIVRDYVLPAFVNEHTLVIACSFSGNTEETLACLAEAQQRKASIITLSGGGTIKDRSTANSIPHFHLSYQSTCGQPRVNAGVMLTTVLGILEKLNLIPSQKAELERIATVLETLNTTWHPHNTTSSEEKENHPLHLAELCLETIPVFHGSGFLTPLALRCKQDINETGKGFAYAETVPECNHNALVGYQFPPARTNLLQVALRSSFDHPRNSIRFDIMRTLWEKESLPHATLIAQGKNKLEHALYVLYFSMYTAFYLGLLRSVDPTPVEVIKFLKGELANR